mmetsp:Transcript_17984/g.25188  ORF Transcript_17984/g.25188 Transcript_17984/m.25188 type:complete len:134 (-) Transcript_17984:1127-1528(-)
MGLRRGGRACQRSRTRPNQFLHRFFQQLLDNDPSAGMCPSAWKNTIRTSSTADSAARERGATTYVILIGHRCPAITAVPSKLPAQLQKLLIIKSVYIAEIFLAEAIFGTGEVVQIETTRIRAVCPPQKVCTIF